ncbi:MAG: YidC/Oxa1 family membrane protein insertase [Bacilli bacterium]|nr:YidC/Oxa1 family membrane protein insertase [Bacilli bacterium]
MNNKTKKIIIAVIMIFLLTGCAKTLKDKDNKVIINKNTGQSITENIICKPTNKEVIKIYKKNKVKISKLPSCEKFTPLADYEGLWTSIFVKPLAWLILKIGKALKSYGSSIIVTCLLIRLALMPVTQKTAMQSELLKKAQPELDKLEKKYKGKDSQEDQTKKAQEMMMIYKKYNINPMGGCILAFVQLPLLFAFLEAINRTPALFENNFLFYQMGTTPWVGLATHHNYWYILLLVLIIGTSFFSFRKTMKDQSGPAASSMKYTLYFMMAMIAFASLSLPAALGIYWITSSLFTIGQNIYVERKKVK